jgi:hypothetical protein
MSELTIIKLLQKAVTPLTTLPVKYLNTNFKPPENGKWWEVLFIPTDVPDTTLGNEQMFQGIFRLLLHWPQDNKGVYKALEEVDVMREGFKKGSRFDDVATNTTVSVRENPDVSSIVEESPNLLIPLTIKYHCYKI